MITNQMQYKNEFFIRENDPTDGILVVEANLQGIMELSPHQKVFKKAFPKTFKAFMELCVEEKAYAGDCIFFKEDNYIIAIIITSEKVLGKNKDDDELLTLYTELALEQLFNQIKTNDTIISGIINRYSNLWKETQSIIEKLSKSKNINWLVYRN